MRERSWKSWDDHQDKYLEYNLLNANEVHTIGQNQALMVSANRNPVLLDVLPHYANPKLARAIRRGGYELPTYAANNDLAWVPLVF